MSNIIHYYIIVLVHWKWQIIANQLAYRRAIAVKTIIIVETQQKDTTIKRFPVIIHIEYKRINKITFVCCTGNCRKSVDRLSMQSDSFRRGVSKKKSTALLRDTISWYYYCFMNASSPTRLGYTCIIMTIRCGDDDDNNIIKRRWRRHCTDKFIVIAFGGGRLISDC